MGLGQFIRATAERQRFQVGVELRQKTFECRLNGRLAQTAKIDTEGLLVERQIHNVQTSTRVQQCRQNSTSPPFVHSAAVVQPIFQRCEAENFSENPSREAIECRFQLPFVRRRFWEFQRRHQLIWTSTTTAEIPVATQFYLIFTSSPLPAVHSRLPKGHGDRQFQLKLADDNYRRQIQLNFHANTAQMNNS